MGRNQFSKTAEQSHSTNYLAPLTLVLFALLTCILFIGGCTRQNPPSLSARPAASSVPESGTSANSPVASPKKPKVSRKTVQFFVFGRQLGSIAPCGCTAEPLGGLQFAFGYIEQFQNHGDHLILEPGSFLFSDPEGPHRNKDEAEWAQAEQRATHLHAVFSKQSSHLVSGLGPNDFSSPHGKVALSRWPLPRVLANLAPGHKLNVAPYRIVQLDSAIRVGVTAVVDPELSEKQPSFPTTTEMASTLKVQLEKMKTQGIDLAVAMIHASADRTQQLAEKVSGYDFMIMGGKIEDVETGRVGAVPIRKKDTWIITPGDQAQTISHLSLSIDQQVITRPPGNNADGDKIPPSSSWKIVASRQQRVDAIARTEKRLEKFSHQTDSDPAYLLVLENELRTLQKQLNKPVEGQEPVIAVFEQAKITCHLPQQPFSAQQLTQYDAWVSESNRKRFSGVFAKSPKKGQPHYSGIEECDMCHEEAVEFWKTTVHGRAFATLERTNKQYDLSCVGCHVTGFRQPGGSEVVENKGLRDVQCEQCHGPGNIHADDSKKSSIQLHSPIKVCLECHTPEHSDTFDYIPYMRDVLGPGHGADARAKLGDGPTGHELRAAALKKAGGGCKKM